MRYITILILFCSYSFAFAQQKEICFGNRDPISFESNQESCLDLKKITGDNEKKQKLIKSLGTSYFLNDSVERYNLELPLASQFSGEPDLLINLAFEYLRRLEKYGNNENALRISANFFMRTLSYETVWRKRLLRPSPAEVIFRDENLSFLQNLFSSERFDSPTGQLIVDLMIKTMKWEYGLAATNVEQLIRLAEKRDHAHASYLGLISLYGVRCNPYYFVEIVKDGTKQRLTQIQQIENFPRWKQVKDLLINGPFNGCSQ